jgi:adenosylcobinamide-GDP ribazoletransferase
MRGIECWVLCDSDEFAHNSGSFFRAPIMPNWYRERDLLLIAIAFLTRIPIPAHTPHTPQNLNAAARYFPLVGAMVGGCGAAVFAIAHLFWPVAIAVALSMVATLLLTGAFHEDGFADCCDGFGGGWRREQVLAIMKDSRIGTYAAVGLISIFAVKFSSLLVLVKPAPIICALIVAHAWSRLLAISYLFDLNYVRDDDSSKIKPMATQLGRNELVVAALSVTPLFLLVELQRVAFIVIALTLWRWLFAKYMRRRLGGYTGDCLGCAQQVAEVLIYLVCSAGVITNS